MGRCDQLLNPVIIALLIVASLDTLMLLIAAGFALRILRHWDIQSGSELQIRLEQQTYLIATLVGFAFITELLSLLLFVYNADALSSQFVGAMCATGVLNVNPWGWPTLISKIIVFFFAALWLALNFIDRQAEDYPLVRIKYGLLLLIAPLMLSVWSFQLKYFLGLNPAVITSCCGSLFSADARGIAAEVSSLTPRTGMLLFYVGGIAVMISGLWYLRKQRTALIFGMCSIGAFITAIIGIVSFVALYIYAHPHHHCPFCILKSGHDFKGYWLYLPLFSATALAISSSAVAVTQRIPSLRTQAKKTARKFGWLALLLYGIFYLLSSWMVLTSNLTLENLWL